MTNISKLVWTGVAVESPSGTAALAPTMYVPCMSKFTNKTAIVYSKEERGTRDVNNVRTTTTRMASGTASGDIYLGSFPYFLYGFMGGISSSQPDNVNAPTAYQHALALADLPPSLTLFKGYDHSGAYWAYTVVEKIKIKWSAEGKVLEHESGLMSQYGVEIPTGAGYTAINDPTYDADDYDAIPGYAPIITIGGVQSDIVEEMDIELSQKIKLKYTSRGNRGFYRAEYSDREAKINFTAQFEDTTFTNKETNDTRDTLVVQFDGVNLGGTINYQFKLNFPIVAYDEVDVDTSKEAIIVKAKCTAMPGATKNSLFTANVINTVTSYAS